MSLNYTAAHSSRISKPKTANPLRRSASSSPFSANPRRKPAQARKKSTDDGSSRLSDTGRIVSLATDPSLRGAGVVTLMKHIMAAMFTPIPERGAGMNSTRIAEVLNFRASLPPVVTVAHVHALGRSATEVEREIAELVRRGVVRKVVVPGRGVGGSAVGEGLVLVEEWERLVRECKGLEGGVKEKYTNLLRTNPTTLHIPLTTFTPAEASSLTAAGFLTSSSAATGNADLFLRPGAATLGTLASLSTAGSSYASGSIGAVGGSNIDHAAGGGGAGATTSSTSSYTLSLPNVGPYLKLLTSARSHLLHLLSKTSPKWREAPLDVLRERWDGGIAADDEAGRAKKARGEWAGVAPGRTKKWKGFYGLRFEWVLEECVRSGVVECFETGSVGVGVRGV